MTSVNLTDEKCRRATARSGRVTEYSDNRQRGLALRVSPPSNSNPRGTKSWTIRYRTRAGVQKRISLGGYPEVTLAKARRRALSVLASVAEGNDPATDMKTARAKAKFGRLETVKAIGKHYLAEAQRGRHRANARPKRPSTLALERYYFDRYVEPAFGRRSITDLRRAELQDFINRMADEHSSSTARQCRVVLQRLFALAQWQEITDANPCQHVHAPRGRERDRVLSDEELRIIWDATTLPLSSSCFHLSPAMAIALRLVAVTMQRRSEIAAIHTREIDQERRIWTIPAERTKNHLRHVVPISDAALDLINAALALSGRKVGYLFPSPRDATRPVTNNSLTHAFVRLAAANKLKDVRLHDLRRTGATHLTSERGGIPRFVVSRVLNQISDTGGAASVTKVYDRNDYLSAKRRALDAWANLLAEVVSGRTGLVLQDRHRAHES